MHGHRKLLVLGLNTLLERGLISLDPDVEVVQGHLLVDLAGEPAAIMWHGISGDEVSLSVWWKYDHSQHPQAELQGNRRESFHGPAPLAKEQHYPKFVGAVASAWVERRTAPHLQGYGAKGFAAKYCRRGEVKQLHAISTPVPLGFAAEGRFFA